MAEKITVPTLGESVTEATVSKWLKSQGEEVIADEPLVELETDKVNVEVPSPTSGVLGSIAVREGETVNVGSLLGIVDGSSKKKVIILRLPPLLCHNNGCFTGRIFASRPLLFNPGPVANQSEFCWCCYILIYITYGFELSRFDKFINLRT